MPITDSAMALTRLKQEIIDHGVCSELAETAQQLVMGDGKANADIIFIGEAPGKKEDESGTPFVGASGKFLDAMLAGAGLDRNDVYITNIVKYRPPNNRDPTIEEKAAFWPYLLRQIDIVSPKVIITLGKHSGSAFISSLVISRDHGKIQKVLLGDKKLIVMPLYHPAAALYNGSLRQTLHDDMIAAAKIADMHSS